MTTNPSARIQLVARNQLKSPANCVLCGNSTSIEGFLDPDIYFEWEGNVYFCWNCTVQIAHTIGCLLPDEAEALKEQANAILAKNQELEEKLNEYEPIIAAVRNVVVLPTFGSDSDSDSSANEVEQEQPADVIKPADVSGGRKPVAKKSVASSRSNDAPQSKSRDQGLNL